MGCLCLGAAKRLFHATLPKPWFIALDLKFTDASLNFRQIPIHSEGVLSVLAFMPDAMRMGVATMKNTVFFAGCAIALAGQAHALAQTDGQPSAIGFPEFLVSGEVAGWVVPAFEGAVEAPWVQLARRGSDDAGGDDNSGHGGGDDDSDDDDSDDDDDDYDDGDDDSDEDGSSSGRDRPRVPGGSGCDDPGDAQEHAECNV